MTMNPVDTKMSDDSSEEDEPIQPTLTSATTTTAATITAEGTASIIEQQEVIKSEPEIKQEPKPLAGDDQVTPPDDDAEKAELDIKLEVERIKKKFESSMKEETTTTTEAVEELTLAQKIARLSPKSQSAYERIQEDAYVTESWMTLLSDIQKVPISRVRWIYEHFFELFPTAGKYWKLYAEQELAAGNLEKVQDILNRALMTQHVLDIELWKFYLNFTKVTKVDPIAATVAASGTITDAQQVLELKRARQIMNDAYLIALDKMGASLHASFMWQGYLQFLKSDKDPQGFLAVRKWYQKAVTMPLNQMEVLWKEYEHFEKTLPNNEALAQNLLKLYRPRFEASRAIARDRKVLWEGLNVHCLAVPKRSVIRDTQLHKWITVVEFELTNPERLDPINWKSRVRLVFEQALMCQRFSAEMWYQYAVFERESAGDYAAAARIFRRALVIMPDSNLLSFSFADHEELRNDIPSAKLVYENLLKHYPSPLVYITYQRFARRAFGAQGLDEARSLFKRARKDTREGACSHHVYIASALLEYHTNSTQDGGGRTIALNIFELGLKKYITEIEYVVNYLDFLSHLNEDNNMRSLFEKVLSVLDVAKSQPIWSRYIHFELFCASTGGNLETVQKLERRRAEAFAALAKENNEKSKIGLLALSGLPSIAHRYEFLNLRSTTREDAKFYSIYFPSSSSSSFVNPLASIRDYASSSSISGSRLVSSDHESGPRPVVDDNDTFSATTTTDLKDVTFSGPLVPEFLKPLLVHLPLGKTWNGPIADVDVIYRTLVQAKIPSRDSIVARVDELMYTIGRRQGGSGGHKTGGVRSSSTPGDEDAESSSLLMKRPPTHDVFRTRQQQKLAKLS